MMREEGVTHTAGVPTVWLAMMNHVEATGAELGRLSVVTIGGSAAPRSMIQYFVERGIRVGHAWGMTEMSPLGPTGAPPCDCGAPRQGDQSAHMYTPGRAPFGAEPRTGDDEATTRPNQG